VRDERADLGEPGGCYLDGGRIGHGTRVP
jgi:hypothetical protein